MHGWIPAAMVLCMGPGCQTPNAISVKFSLEQPLAPHSDGHTVTTSVLLQDIPGALWPQRCPPGGGAPAITLGPSATRRDCLLGK